MIAQPPRVTRNWLRLVSVRRRNNNSWGIAIQLSQQIWWSRKIWQLRTTPKKKLTWQRSSKWSPSNNSNIKMTALNKLKLAVTPRIVRLEARRDNNAIAATCFWTPLRRRFHKAPILSTKSSFHRAKLIKINRGHQWSLPRRAASITTGGQTRI